MKMHKWIILKDMNYAFCGAKRTKDAFGIVTDWRQVNCKKCLQKRKETTQPVKNNGAQTRIHEENK